MKTSTKITLGVWGACVGYVVWAKISGDKIAREMEQRRLEREQYKRDFDEWWEGFKRHDQERAAYYREQTKWLENFDPNAYLMSMREGTTAEYLKSLGLTPRDEKPETD